MKAFSTYMREGAALHPQAFDDYIVWCPNPYEPHTCAIGCIYEAITGYLPPSAEHDEGQVMQTIMDATGVTPTTTIPYPDGIPGGIFDVIAYCNDELRWPRERTAAYLQRYGW